MGIAPLSYSKAALRGVLQQADNKQVFYGSPPPQPSA